VTSSELKDLQSTLLDEVGSRVAPLGFVRPKNSQSYKKRIEGGWQSFHLAFIKHSQDFAVTADVAIRFDRLEELIDKHTPAESRNRLQNAMASIGAELGNIAGDGQSRWTVARATEIDSVANSIFQDFLSIGLPYLEKYCSLEAAVDAISGDDAAARLHSPFHHERALRAIGLSYLLRDARRFSRLAAAKEEYLRGRSDPGLQPFLKIKDALASSLANI
jgi:hypothetical protein